MLSSKVDSRIAHRIGGLAAAHRGAVSGAGRRGTTARSRAWQAGVPGTPGSTAFGHVRTWLTGPADGDV